VRRKRKKGGEESPVAAWNAINSHLKRDFAGPEEKRKKISGSSLSAGCGKGERKEGGAGVKAASYARPIRWIASGKSKRFDLAEMAGKEKGVIIFPSKNA